MIRLGVNIDHVATLRQARRQGFPDPLKAALEAVEGGADGITAHLREDRRHIQDADIIALKKSLPVPLNMEMSLSPEILRVALKVKPTWVCLVPERREELTTEGGLDVAGNRKKIKSGIERLHDAGILVSLFVSASRSTALLSRELGADAIELHTGSYDRKWGKPSLRTELKALETSARAAASAGLLVNAGHGLNYDNVAKLGGTFRFHEYNIGFAIVAHAVSVGLREAVRQMKKVMNS
jgi:pyridoxine 5-phosphate synthase